MPTEKLPDPNDAAELAATARLAASISRNTAKLRATAAILKELVASVDAVNDTLGDIAETFARLELKIDPRR